MNRTSAICNLRGPGDRCPVPASTPTPTPAPVSTTPRDDAPPATDSGDALRRSMNLSLGVGIGLLIVKVTAAAVTRSTAILSDAAESVVHLLAVAFASYSIRLARKPADVTHQYGHDRISFLSAGFEGAMIITAAIFIVYEAVRTWVERIPVVKVDAGIGLTVLAMAVNTVLARHLLHVARERKSIILEANGRHILSDVWTSIAVLAGLSLVRLTGWRGWDTICAALVALNLIIGGWVLIRRSIGGLMDEADPELHARLEAILGGACAPEEAGFHRLRHRDAGHRLFVDVHLTFPDGLTILDAHRRATRIERSIRDALDREVQVTTHLEPRDHHDIIHPPDHAPPGA